MVNFSSIPVHGGKVLQCLGTGPVVLGDYVMQPVKLAPELVGEAVFEIDLGEMLEAKFKPPKSLGLDTSDLFQTCAWVGGRMRHLFFGGDIADDEILSDGEWLLNIDFACCRINKTHTGFHVAYTSKDGWASLWFGIKEDPTLPDDERPRFTNELYGLLTAEPEAVVDYVDRHDFGSFGVRHGKPFFDFDG